MSEELRPALSWKDALLRINELEQENQKPGGMGFGTSPHPLHRVQGEKFMSHTDLLPDGSDVP